VTEFYPGQRADDFRVDPANAGFIHGLEEALHEVWTNKYSQDDVLFRVRDGRVVYKLVEPPDYISPNLQHVFADR
jgi:hypothetical protein